MCDDREGIVAGGQGRTGDEVRSNGVVTGVCFVLAIALVALIVLSKVMR